MDDATELARLRARIEHQQRFDEFLEAATLRRAPLADMLGEALPLLRSALGARAVWVHTLDEELAPRVFSVGDATPQDLVERASAAVGGAPGARTTDRPAPSSAQVAAPGGGLVLARRLDVAGTAFGTLGARLATQPAKGELEHHEGLVHVTAELLDNLLADVRHAREKQVLLRGIHEDLRHALVHEGVRRAVARIAPTVRFDLLVVLYHLREDYERTIHYLVFRGEELEFRSGEKVSAELGRLLAKSRMTKPGGAPLIVRDAEVDHLQVSGGTAPADLAKEGETEKLLESIGYREFVESVLIAGIAPDAIVGKVVVGSKHPLSTYERDVLTLFADVLQKRIVDYNELGEHLRHAFPIPTVLRLLEEEDHLKRLAPRSADISILFADVAGFTSVSEQHLREPAKVSAFIEAWSRGVTRIVWEHGGVFDKLVGDCIIGLFGPPFFEHSPAERAAACVRAAVAMAKFTREMIDDPACAPIKAAGAPLGIATGLNDCAASVGLFGPDQDYTAFSSGMNNTARLQGLATRDEILVMAPMKELLEQANLGFRFGPRREGKAKNVAEPLVFFAVDPDSVT